ncbi:Cytochrome P450 [Macrophomina phaseolina MS6]|uniref:Cytochrome P450 n=1 Tax=Macrophomina phaseolina (strain MS6) TaxID=1126212 RepID=K2R1Y9_MACPH|nr:Cytochrome P450 [Macrophomina phaseolina MS6]
MVTLCFPAIFIVFILYKAFTCGSQIPHSLPWVGQNVKGPFKRTRSYIRSIFGTKAMLEEGYQRVHDQSEEHFSGLEAHNQFMRGDYTLLNPLMCSEHVFEDAIKKHLTRGLDGLLPALAEEVGIAVSRRAGLSMEQWKEVDGFRVWKMIMVQVVSRIYVGKPLCRDEAYLDAAGRFNQMVIFNAGIIGAVPELLRPLVAKIILFPDRMRHRAVAKMAGPAIGERLLQVQRIAESEKVPDYSQLPNDLLSWAAVDAVESVHTHPEKSSVNFLAQRLSVMNFVSTDSTTITLGNMLFDMLLAPLASGQTPLVQRVQAELEAAHSHYLATANSDPAAAKTFIDSLPLLDACLKESFRLRNFISRGLVKTATSRSHEVAVPGVGVVPAGVKIGIPVWGIHHDESRYEDARTWRCERWLDDNGPAQNTPVTGGGLAHTTRAYMPFGFKRTACPGRFYATRLVKLILAYFLLNYDIKLAGKTPPVHYWWGISVSPPRDANLLIRRRTQPDGAPFLGLRA